MEDPNVIHIPGNNTKITISDNIISVVINDGTPMTADIRSEESIMSLLDECKELGAIELVSNALDEVSKITDLCRISDITIPGETTQIVRTGDNMEIATNQKIYTCNITEPDAVTSMFDQCQVDTILKDTERQCGDDNNK